MPKLKPETEHARRQNILDAAQRCFARRGFHATSMQDICKEALVSPGALYVYFDSKEALIAGLCERDRAELTERLDGLCQAPDFLAALNAIGESYFVDDPASKQCVVWRWVLNQRAMRALPIFSWGPTDSAPRPFRPCSSVSRMKAASIPRWTSRC